MAGATLTSSETLLQDADDDLYELLLFRLIYALAPALRSRNVHALADELLAEMATAAAALLQSSSSSAETFAAHQERVKNFGRVLTQLVDHVVAAIGAIKNETGWWHRFNEAEFIRKSRVDASVLTTSSLISYLIQPNVREKLYGREESAADGEVEDAGGSGDLNSVELKWWRIILEARAHLPAPDNLTLDDAYGGPALREAPETRQVLAAPSEADTLDLGLGLGEESIQAAAAPVPAARGRGNWRAGRGGGRGRGRGATPKPVAPAGPRLGPPRGRGRGARRPLFHASQIAPDLPPAGGAWAAQPAPDAPLPLEPAAEPEIVDMSTADGLDLGLADWENEPEDEDELFS